MRKRFAIKYDADEVLNSAFPFVLEGNFAGPVLESPPLKLAPEKQIAPFITEVSSDGLISLGFSEMMMTSVDQFAEPMSTAVRKLSQEVTMQKKDGSQGQYDVFEAIEITLTSSQSEEFAPI